MYESYVSKIIYIAHQLYILMLLHQKFENASFQNVPGSSFLTKHQNCLRNVFALGLDRICTFSFFRVLLRSKPNNFIRFS